MNDDRYIPPWEQDPEDEKKREIREKLEREVEAERIKTTKRDKILKWVLIIAAIALIVILASWAHIELIRLIANKS
ncbi:MAG: hypothetical protein J5614_08545 [Paludibacteraceae bacterium]|nr:hypothetical protein [Paludibacteraceae bacterium]